MFAGTYQHSCALFAYGKNEVSVCVPISELDVKWIDLST